MVNLSELSRNVQRAAGILEEIEQARMRATRTTSTLDGMPHTQKTRSKVEGAAVAIAYLEEKYADLLEEIRQAREELADMITALADPDQQAVLRLRYIKGYRPETIAAGINLCVRSVFTKLDQGKAELMRLYPGRFVDR